MQTGSNFGADQEHDTPFLIDIGPGTMVSDGATFIDADYSSTSFRVTPLSIGPGDFIGNAVAYPAGGRTGENCLVATKAMVPLDGPVRNNTGLLGSPCFEILRSVTADDRFDHLRTGEEFRRRLRAKNRHNVATMALFLAVRWVDVFVVTLFATAAWEFYGGNPVLVLTGLTLATVAADHTVLEDGVTLGTGAFVHYGVTIGKDARLQPDSFLMKGEKVPPGARWGGNPARAV